MGWRVGGVSWERFLKEREKCKKLRRVVPFRSLQLLKTIKTVWKDHMTWKVVLTDTSWLT